MEKCIAFIFSLVSISTFGQKIDTFRLLIHIDSIINAKVNFVENECNTVELLTGEKVYKCWNYYYKDSSKEYVAKVSISFDNLSEELIYYFENNKVIKAEKNIVTKRRTKREWTLYFDNDMQILGSGKVDLILYDKIEQAYYFLNNALRHAKKKIVDFPT